MRNLIILFLAAATTLPAAAQHGTCPGDAQFQVFSERPNEKTYKGILCRQALENDWRAEALRKAEAENYRRVLAGYDVVIEMPK